MSSEDNLSYTIDVYNGRGQHFCTLVRVADLSAGLRAFAAAKSRYPGVQIALRHEGRVVEDSKSKT